MQRDLIKKLDLFFSKFHEYQFKKNEILIQAGKEPSGIFYIKKGIVRQYLISQKGDEITLNLFKPHTFLPMSWAIGDVENNHFYEALTPVIVRLAPKKLWIDFLQQQPDITYDLLRRIFVGLDGLWKHIESLMSGDSYHKLVTTIVILAKRFGEKEKDTLVIRLKLREKDIANYAGMSRETASRELQKLKKQHIVTFSKGIIIIHEFQRLENSLFA